MTNESFPATLVCDILAAVCVCGHENFIKTNFTSFAVFRRGFVFGSCQRATNKRIQSFDFEMAEMTESENCGKKFIFL